MYSRRKRKTLKKQNVVKKRKTTFVCSQKGGDITSSINAITSNIKLPWGKYKGEMHLPGMNFAGPGTRLDLRLDANGFPIESSRPVDRVDDAAFRHDLAYSKFTDTKRRNIADKIMISELNDLPNPTLRERIERAIIKPILQTKSNFGL
jgi:hypothetical protein